MPSEGCFLKTDLRFIFLSVIFLSDAFLHEFPKSLCVVTEHLQSGKSVPVASILQDLTARSEFLFALRLFIGPFCEIEWHLRVFTVWFCSSRGDTVCRVGFPDFLAAIQVGLFAGAVSATVSAAADSFFAD